MDLPLVVGGLNPRAVVLDHGEPNARCPRDSQSPGATGPTFPNDLFDNFISLYRIDAGFTPALGFVQRTGIWENDFPRRFHAPPPSARHPAARSPLPDSQLGYHRQ